jgi:hypothetical protein
MAAKTAATFKKIAGVKVGSGLQKLATGGSVAPPAVQYIQVNGQTVAVPAGHQYVPGSAGVHTPTIQPFQTSDDMMNVADSEFDLGQGLADLDKGFADLKTNVDYEKRQVDKSEVASKNTTIDDMIARGLGQSSIRDGEIYDIQATASMRRNFLDTTLGSAEIALGTNKARLQKRHDDIQKAIDQKAMENAAALAAQTPDYVPGQEPTEGQIVPIPGMTAPAAHSPAKATHPKPHSAGGFQATGPVTIGAGLLRRATRP